MVDSTWPATGRDRATSRAVKPNVAPARISLASRASSCSGASGTGGSSGAISGTRRAAIARAKPARIMDGISVSAKPGRSMTAATLRASTRLKAKAQPERECRKALSLKVHLSSRHSPAAHGDHFGEDLPRMVLQRREHEWPHQHEHRADRDHFWHEGQGGFMDLRDGLQDR